MKTLTSEKFHASGVGDFRFRAFPSPLVTRSHIDGARSVSLPYFGVQYIENGQHRHKCLVSIY